MTVTKETSLLPEQKARVWIDEKLREAGWQVVDRQEYSPDMGAVAIRETLMEGNHETDYLLLVGGKAAGLIEAKRNEVSLDDPDLIRQAENYRKELLPEYPCWENPIPLVYLSNGKEIGYRNFLEKDSEYEIIERFPRPKDVVSMLKLPGYFDALPYLSPKGLRDCQFKAISGLEKSFRAGKTRALMTLATGAGKTFTACMIAYRMLAYTPAKRVLFLVDRHNLGAAAKAEFQAFKLTDNGKSFSEIYEVEQLSSRDLVGRSGVVVGTIQRLYSQLCGNKETNVSEEEEDAGLGHKDGELVELPEVKKLPPDFFDLIIIDECHRSIYSDWRKVLEYFSKARLIGMTATPIPQTQAFFDDNVVANYSYEQSVADGVNVMFRIYRVKTELGENGGDIEEGDRLKIIRTESRKVTVTKAEEDAHYEKTQLNRKIFVKDQIRKVLQQYKDVVYKEMFPDREPNYDYLPKTLIFANSDIHADFIVDIAKEVFGRSDDRFVQKITYSVEDSNARIRSFRNDKDFRIAVTVTLVATGTDVKPLEVLIFLHDVHSETLYMQMKGRGVRSISDEQLRSVTPNAHGKELFFVIDAVGVTESEKIVPKIVDPDGENADDDKGDSDDGGKGDCERLINPSLEKLFERIALKIVPDDYLQLLAGKLCYVQKHALPEDMDEFLTLCPVKPAEFASRILNALTAGTLPPFKSSNEENKERMDLVGELITNIPARNKLIEISKGFIKEHIDGEDTVINAGFLQEDALHSVSAFEKYVGEHKDEIEALRLIYNNQVGALTRQKIEELQKKIMHSIPGFTIRRAWEDYRMLKPKKVSQPSTVGAITDLIQLVRFAYGSIDNLVSLTSLMAQRFELWCGQKQRSMTPEQKELFKKIAVYIVQNGGYSFASLHGIAPELTLGLLRFMKAKAANEQILSLNEFILKVA